MIHVCDDLSNLTPFEVWSTYTACNLHFKKGSKYDAFKFNFKGPRLKRETFMAHRQRYAFEKLATRSKNQVVGYFVANIIQGNTWISNMSSDVYIKWCGQIQNAGYHFKNEMSYIANLGISFDDLFTIDDYTGNPTLYDMHASNKICLESLVMLDILVGYSSRINKNANDPLEIISDLTHKIVQYKPFIQSTSIDLKKARQTVLNLFTSVHK